MSDTATKTVSWPRPAVAWFAVGVLVLAFIFSIADRIIIGLMVDPIKADLGLTDSDMGLMMGPAFALFYALMGLPIGRMVDKRSRTLIVSAGIFLWSIMTALCGMARSFWKAYCDECHLPWLNVADEWQRYGLRAFGELNCEATKDQCETHTEKSPRLIDTERPAKLFFRKGVGNH